MNQTQVETNPPSVLQPLRKPPFSKEAFPKGLLVYNIRLGVLYKLSNAYDSYFSLAQVWPIPNRTTVHSFPWEDALKFREAPRNIYKKYEEAWAERSR